MSRIKTWLAAALCAALLLTGAAAALAEGGELVVAQAADAVSLDPHRTNESASAIPMFQIYDTLVKLDADMQIVPGLASEWKQVDDYTLEFKLREDVKFHNGEMLTANDVKFTYDRITDPATAAPAAFMLSTLKETKVIDEHTVQLIFSGKCASMLYNLTHVDMGILNEKAVTEAGDAYAQNPVGTGAFKFVEWKKNQEIVLEKNPDYYGEPATSDRLVFRIIPESSTGIAELQTGGVDILMGVQPQYVPQFAEGSGMKLERFNTFTIKYMGFDMRQKPFDDGRVRQAINYATNKEAIIKVAYNDSAEPLAGPLPARINGRNEDLTPYPYDPEKAKALLAEAGYPDGFTSTLYLSDKEVDTKIATVLQGMLAQVGIKVDLQVIEWGAYLKKTAEGVPMYLLGWTTVTADADNGMYSNFHSSAWGSQGNRMFYKNDRVDELLDMGRSEFNPEERVKLYQEASQIIYDDAAWNFLAAEQSMVGMRDYVEGFQPMPTMCFNFAPVSVNK